MQTHAFFIWRREVKPTAWLYGGIRIRVISKSHSEVFENASIRQLSKRQICDRTSFRASKNYIFATIILCYTLYMQTFFTQHKGLIIGGGIVLALLLWVVGSYNSLVSLNESVNTQWAQVETQYQRRFDLIPNLVASVQGIMKQETTVFTAIANARQGYAGARTTDEKALAAGQMESALSRLLVITENYPQLKSSENVQSLMAQLEGTENRVSVERMRYNELVNAWNVKVKTFPGIFVAKLFGFEAKKAFESEEGAAKAPKVNF